ncbi:MAG: type IV pilus secretin PilQ [Thiolinea sp.]
MKIMKQTAIWVSCGLLGYCLSTAASAAVLNKLQVVDVKASAANKAEVRLDFVQPVTIPKGFVLENPPRIVLDFPQVEVLPKARRNAFGTGVIKSIDAANNKGHARVVVSLKSFVNYTVEARGDDLVLIFDAPDSGQPVKPIVNPIVNNAQKPAANIAPEQSYKWYRAPGSAGQAPAQQMVQQPAQQVAPKPVHKPAQKQPVQQVAKNPVHQPAPRMAPVVVPPAVSVAQPVPAPRRPVQQHVQPPARVTTTPAQRPAVQQAPAAVNALRSVDFRRNANGGGRVIITLPHANVNVADNKRANTLNLTLNDIDVPANWQKRLDVLDFATPVSAIQISQRGGNGHLSVIGHTGFDYRIEKDRNVYTVHIDKIQQETKKLKLGEKEKKVFKGEKLSLNFQDIEVRAVLQLLADFTDKNIVVSDSVNGSITVRLKDVPWDQALDIVLESKNLGMRENGSVIWVAPSSELDAKDARELEIAKRKIELEPLVTEYIPVNFAKAADLLLLIEKRSNTDEEGHSLLSNRGSISSDERTNTLLVKDTAEQIAQIRELVKVLDIPVQQVLIESRIVIANDEFGKELGARFGAAPRWVNNDSRGLGAGTIGTGASDTYYTSIAEASSSEDGGIIKLPGINDRLNVNLPVVGAAGSFGFSILTSDFMLDLELSALQAESKGEIIATPRVITSNQTKALIEQGVEIPYQQASSSGATNVAFKKAVLSLEVTPQITPDEHISMDLKVNQDTVGQVFNNVPSIDTREIQTKVLVENGQTIVLGGVHEETNINGLTKVPVLGDLPVVGQLFRKTNKSENKRELLIFVTPKIVDSNGQKIAER